MSESGHLLRPASESLCGMGALERSAGSRRYSDAIRNPAARAHRPVTGPHDDDAFRRCIFLVDVDNIALAGTAVTSPALAERRLREVVASAFRWDLSLAVASRRLVRENGLLHLMRDLGLTCRLDAGGPDAADQELCDFALHGIEQGTVTRVVVASGDGIFADLATRTRLSVSVPHDHKGVAQRLGPYLIAPPACSANGASRRGGAGHPVRTPAPGNSRRAKPPGPHLRLD